MQERVAIIIESLSPIERELLKTLSSKYQNVATLAKKAEQDEITALRAAGYLKNKKLIKEETSVTKTINLGILGLNYHKKELPERSLLNKLVEKKILPIGEIKNACGLNDNEAKAALGILKKKGYADIKQGKLQLSRQAKPAEISNKLPEELFLEQLPISLEDLDKEDKNTFEGLKARKDLVEVTEEKITKVKLTSLGQEIAGMDLNDNLIEQLTPKMIKQGNWKGKKFRRYDITSAVPRLYGGKQHFVNQAKDYAKRIWLDMGFKEMTGTMADTSFWVFDTLFTAQDHPVRDMQDTFYLKDVKGQLPKESSIIKQTKKAHEGGIDGSSGWQNEWDEEQAKKVLLRTHTTCLSVRTLQKIAKNKEFPAKYFALGKCFRNETVDWSHGFEFNQTEGIVVDENANFRQLLGYLKQFFKKMGYEKIRIRPAYFAYTEPSLEIDVFHPKHKKWVELGGAGMFRPEVTIPMFGRHIPVLAWGPGFDRIIMEYFQINDLREMYKNDINKLREMRYWNK